MMVELELLVRAGSCSAASSKRLSPALVTRVPWCGQWLRFVQGFEGDSPGAQGMESPRKLLLQPFLPL